ncbi:pyridoxal phosphate-dependent decarboxylase family protein [Marinigracilibium pacificum]|uniref:Aspartate aminotransferase family protein n=1 Tax=Marinigracilibium pacificum TaxID=2729599 RepID=A0A848IWG8_9BACT|nr:aminotransferase class V-fold PLP-dependent enzyme [Marinigracilibium pacificum]NMM47611.1 aspartate aminotransferase family protein [Marinigracilibium pacificum]
MSELQKQMLSELQDESLFKKAESFGLEYLSKVLDRNVYPTEEALENLSAFEEKLPDDTGNAHEVIEMLHKYGSPATVAQVGGRYFGFVNGSVVPAGLAAKNLSIFWDQNTAMQVLSPISSKLETVVQKWLTQLFGLPDRTVAGFVSGTSMANFCGLAAARYRVLQNNNWDFNENGLFGAPKIRVVTGKDAHSTVLKAIALNGLGKGNIEWVDTEEEGRIIPDKIPELDSNTILILQAGNVNSGSFDDFSSICEKARSQGAWIHIDGAFGLWAGATKKLKHLTKGFEHANSWAVDGHKTLNTPYDSGIIMCDDQEALMSSLHMSGGYIIQGKDRDGMFYTPEMSRRARIIELWATFKYLGKNGVDQMVYNLNQRAIQFANEISKAEGFSVLNEVVFNQVIVQCETEELTNKVIEEVQKLRECWVGGSIWKGKRVIRISVCSWVTNKEDITRSVNSFIKAREIAYKQIQLTE